MKIGRIYEALFLFLFVFYVFKFSINEIPIVYIYVILLMITLLPFLLYTRHKLDLFVLIFVIYIISQTLLAWAIWGIWGEESLKAFRAFILVVGNIVLYIIFAPYLTLKSLVNITSITGIIYIPFAFYELINIQTKGLYRYTSTFEDPNYFGILIILFMTAFLIKVLVYKSKFTLLYVNLLIMSILILFFTFSRSTYLALFAYSVILLFYHLRESIQIRSVIKYLFITVIAITTIVYLLISLVQFDNLILFLEWRFFSDSEIESGFSRLHEIAAGIKLLTSEFPLSLIGVGTASTEIYSFFSQYYTTNSLIEPRIHNTFVSVLIENGIVGFLFFLFLLYRNFSYIKNSNNRAKPYIVSLFFSFLVSSLFVWNLYYLPFYVTIFYIPMLMKK